MTHFRSSIARILLFAITLVTYSASLARAEEPWRIGVFVCITAECAESGDNSKRGIELAVEELNNTGGVLGRKVEYKLEDTDEYKSGGRGAVTAFKKLLLDTSIHYFIGPSWTTGGLSVAPLGAARPDLIITSPSLGVPDFNLAGPNLFNTWPHDEIATKFVGDYALKKGWKRAAVFSSQGPWEIVQGRIFEKHFREIGGTITDIEEPLPTNSDLRTESLKIRNSAPDVVFLSDYTQMGVAAKRLRAIAYTGPILAILMDTNQVKISEGALNGALFAGYPAPDSKFVENYTRKFGTAPGIGADTSYDTVKLYAWAIEAEKSFDTKVVQARLPQAKYQGASGLIEFDGSRGVRKSPTLYRIDGEKRTLVE